MPCEKRKRAGYCKHFQCPYEYETEHGYDCVELILGKYCEVGEGCLTQCDHSWPIGETPAEVENWLAEAKE